MNNTKSILEKWLKENKYDGLVSYAGDCGCGFGDLMPCDGPCDKCVPGYQGPDPEGEYNFLIYPTKAAADTAKAADAAKTKTICGPAHSAGVRPGAPGVVAK